MGSPVKEIELKLQLDNKQLDILRKWLDQHAVYEGVNEQQDHYFDQPHKSFFFTSPHGIRDAVNSLRVRLTPRGDFLCYKKLTQDEHQKQVIGCEEYETPVAKGGLVVKMLQALGYQLLIEIHKHRIIYRYNQFEIVIDHIHALGTFVEVELKEHDGDQDGGIRAIIQLLKQIGISSCKKLGRGYCIMALNPTKDFRMPLEMGE